MLEANIGDLVITGKGVFTVESINTTQTQEGTSTSISGHAPSGYFRSVKHGTDAYEVISNPTPQQALKVYFRERKLARLNESIGNYDKNRIISRYYSNNPDTHVALTLANPKAVKETRAKMGKLERELNSLREWVMERYLEYSTKFAAALEAHSNPYAPLEIGGEKVIIKKHEFQVGRVYSYEYRRPKRHLFFDNRTTYAKVYRVTKTRAYVELAGGKKGYIANNANGLGYENLKMVMSDAEYVIRDIKEMPFGNLQEASRHYEHTHSRVSLSSLAKDIFYEHFFPQEGATPPALFDTRKEMESRVAKKVYANWKFEEGAQPLIERAIFEVLSEIDKGIMYARMVTRQVEAFYAGE